MDRPRLAPIAARLVPLALLLAAFGRLVAHPAGLLVDADRPTVDRARLVAAAPGNDLTRQHWPLHLYLARCRARTGHTPAWDDRGFGGRPLVGNPQAGLFYPPACVARLTAAPAILGWLTVAHLAGGMVGAGRLARTLGLGGPGRMVAAGCFGLSPYILAQAFEGHYPHVWAVAWYPWAADAAIRLDRGRRRAGLLLAASLAAVALVGHAQEGFDLGIALAVGATAGLVGRAWRGESWRDLAARAIAWAGVAGLGAGLAAVELVPDLLAGRWGLRSARLPVELASRYHPAALNALQLLNPFALGGPTDYFGPENYWETVLGVGLVPLILAAVGATWTADRRRVAGWVALAALAAWFALGRKFGLFAVLYHWVPGVDRFRVPARSLFLANLGVAVLAGFGVEALRDAPVDRWRRLGRRWSVAAAVVMVAVGGAWLAGLGPTAVGTHASADVAAQRRAPRDLAGWRGPARAAGRVATEPTFWVAAVGLTAGLVAGCRRPGRRPAIAAGIGLLGLVELAGAGSGLLVVGPASAFLRPDPDPVAGPVERAGAATPGEPPPTIRADEGAVADLAAVARGWSKTDINDAFQVQHAADLYGRLYDLSRPRPLARSGPMDAAVAERVEGIQQAVMDRLWVVAAVAGPDAPRLAALVAARGWPVEAAGGRLVARNPTALPRAYVVPRAEVVAADGPAVVDRFAAVDPRRAVLMAADPLAGVAVRQAFRAAEWASADPDRVVLRVETTAPGLLVVAQTWMPGWTARVDGRDEPVGRGNHAQQVVPLRSAGRHEVVLAYRPPGYRLGLAITAASIATWGALGLAALARGRGRITP